MTTEIWITYSNSHLVCEKQNNRKQQRSESPTVTLTWCVEKKEEKKRRGNANRDLNCLHQLPPGVWKKRKRNKKEMTTEVWIAYINSHWCASKYKVHNSTKAPCSAFPLHITYAHPPSQAHSAIQAYNYKIPCVYWHARWVTMGNLGLCYCFICYLSDSYQALLIPWSIVSLVICVMSVECC